MHSATSKRSHENGELSHRSVSHHYTLQQRQGATATAATLMEFTPTDTNVRQQRLTQHLPSHHIPHAGRASGSMSGSLKRPPADEDDHVDVPPVAVKRNPDEASISTRPPLTRGESLPAVPFVQERSKHPVRAPSFDTATFKANGNQNPIAQDNM